MLSLLRGFARSKVAMVIIGLLIVGLAAYALPNVFSGAQPRGVISAGDRFLVEGDIERRINDYVQNVYEQEGRIIPRKDLAQPGGPAEQIIQFMASETAQMAYADEEGLRASRFAVSDFVATAPRYQDPVTGEFSEDIYRESIRNQGKSIEDFEGELRDYLTMNYISGALPAGVDVPDALGKVWALAQSEERFISFTLIPADIGGDLAPPTDEELTAFFNERRDMFEEPQRRSFSILSISPADFVDDVEVSDEDVKDFYDFRIKDYSSPETRVIYQMSSKERMPAQRAADEIGLGADARAIASEIEGLNLVERTVQPADILDDFYTKVVFGTPEGEVYGPVEVGDEWITIFVVSVQPGEAQPLEAVEEDIRLQLAQENSVDAFEDSLENFIDLIGGGFSLEEAGVEIGAPVMRFQAVDARGRTADGAQIGAIIARQEALSALNAFAFDGEVSEILDDPVAGGVFVIRLDGTEQANVPDLDQIRPAVENAYMSFKRSTAVQETSSAILAAAREKDDLEAAAAAHQLTVVTPETPISASNIPQAVSRNIVMAALGAAPGQYVETREPNGGGAVVHLVRVKVIDQESLEFMAPAGKSALQQDVISDLQNAFYGEVYTSVDMQLNSEKISAFLKSMTGEE